MKGRNYNKVIRTFLLLLVLFFILGVTHEDDEKDPGCDITYDYEQSKEQRENYLAQFEQPGGQVKDDYGAGDIIPKFETRTVGSITIAEFSDKEGDVFFRGSNLYYKPNVFGFKQAPSFIGKMVDGTLQFSNSGYYPYGLKPSDSRYVERFKETYCTKCIEKFWNDNLVVKKP